MIEIPATIVRWDCGYARMGNINTTTNTVSTKMATRLGDPIRRPNPS